jgi:hypothetical protein
MINITELKKRLLSEAQELSPKQKKIAGAAEPKDKITGADFAALRAKKDVKKEEFGIGAMLKNAMRLLEPEELEAFYNALKDEPVIDKAEYRPDFVDGLKKIIMSKDSDSESAKAAKAILNLPNPGHRYGPDKIDQIFDYIKNKKGDAIQEGGDHEVSMAHNSLESIIKSAMELKAKLGNDERNIPGWIQDHITNAENYIDQAAQGFHELSHDDQGEADYDELPNGTEEEPVDDMHNMSLAGLMEDMIDEKKKPSAGLTKKQKSAISKKAKAGKDIGKKGKGFEKIAKAAAEKYGSKERGQKVAAAAMWKSAAKKAK